MTTLWLRCLFCTNNISVFPPLLQFPDKTATTTRTKCAYRPCCSCSCCRILPFSSHQLQQTHFVLLHVPVRAIQFWEKITKTLLKNSKKYQNNFEFWKMQNKVKVPFNNKNINSTFFARSLKWYQKASNFMYMGAIFKIKCKNRPI